MKTYATFPETIVAVDPKTGAHLRPANEAEVDAIEAACAGPCWTHPNYVRVGDVFVTRYNGPGVWFGGAGF